MLENPELRGVTKMFKKKIRKEVIYVANGMLEAETIKILLESFGIEAFINQESAGLTLRFNFRSPG